MLNRILIPSVIVGLVAALGAAAEAQEWCGCRAASVAPACYASAPCMRSPFRITRLRTMTISSTSSPPEPTAPTMSYGYLHRSVRQAVSCGMH